MEWQSQDGHIYWTISAACEYSRFIAITDDGPIASPQFHVRYDDTFQTLKKPAYVIPSCWQKLSGLQLDKKQTKYLTKADITGNIPITEHSPIINAATTTISPTVVDEVIEDVILHAGNETEEPDHIDENNTDDEDEQQFPTTRAGRVSKPPKRYEDYVSHNANATLNEGGFDTDDMTYSAQAASTDPDVMYLHEALQAPDREQFITAMEKEINSHVSNENWIIVDRKDIPAEKTIVPAVWAMRRKRDIATQQVYKWKARLNFHGGKQQKGLDYWETYAPVASWASIRLIMMIAVFNEWQTKQLDFVLAFPQAPVETELFMDIPPRATR